MRNFLSKTLIFIMLLMFFGAPVANVAYAQEPGEAAANAGAALSGQQTPNQQLAQIQPTAEAKWGDLKCDGWGDLLCELVDIAYVLIFQTVAFFAELCAKILDFFIYYSINSSSYKNDFIEKGWAAIRDVSNIFFIVVLLYVGLKTILSLNVSDNKKLISAVIVIALLINFSLFTTKVIIDASNVLAKIFYNNITPVDEAGQPKPPGYQGSKSISVGLVSAFNPVEIMGGGTVAAKNLGQFFQVMLIGILIMCYMIYMFITVALLFVGRVVALWISMVFSPIAFISYTLPFDIPGFGHKEWWSELLKNAFLAPIFVFFLYIILMFTEVLKGFGINDVGTATGNINTSGGVTAQATDGTFITFMKVIIPFAILFILLMKAKELAVKYSGEIGQAITKAGAVVGGLALGGAALGGAALMRGTVGAFMKGADTGNTAASRMADNRNILQDPNASRWSKFKARTDLIKGHVQQKTGYEKAQTIISNRLNKAQTEQRNASDARHDLNDAAKSVTNGEKTKWEDLNRVEKENAKKHLDRKKVMEQQGGFGTRTYAQLSKKEKDDIDFIVDQNIQSGYDVATQKLMPDANKKQGVRANLLTSAVGGSYDVRNLSKMIVGEQDKTLNKMLTGVTSNLAGAFRSAIKGTTGAQYGLGQKDFLKDLGHTISESLKGAKINVDLSKIGEEKEEK